MDHLSNLTPIAIHQAILDPTTPHIIQVDRSASSPTPSVNLTPEPVRRSFSEIYSPNPSSSAPSSTPKSASMFSSFLRRKTTRTTEWHSGSDSSLDAPPTPPKDKGRFGGAASPLGHQTTFRPQSPGISSGSNAPPVPQKTKRNNISEFAVLSGSFSSDDGVIVVPPPSMGGASLGFTKPLDSKWIQESTVFADPAERTRRRQVAQRQREIQEEQAIAEEKDRQLRLKLRKEEMRKQELKEEVERRAAVEKEIKRITSERQRKEMLEKQEEERKKAELESRKADARVHRQQQHVRLEEWRRQQQAAVAEAATREEENAQKAQEERMKKLKQVEAKVSSGGGVKADELVQGWVSIQAGESLVWRRRFYRFAGHTMFFYRSPKVVIYRF